MKKIVYMLLFASSLLWAEWVMFADSKDTYLYNTQTGEIYIRYKKKGKNYQDVFVKMPRGMSPQEIENHSPTKQETKEDPLLDQKLKSLKQSQDMMNKAIESSF
ncbi:hypothetical protein [Helicobacter pametensis]|uniref:hypothetical protein n=1 Tax=Helicobacter pametensis TaxID=95149 RepID=UPI00047F3003|nr:hypothetical protein [Helicobacter pametensis]